jgi:uncharacterized protein YegP (UPF0339 family)
MNLIWRFYLDQNQQWRWQHLTVNRDVVSESRKGYKEYEGCVENAQGQGMFAYRLKQSRPER